MDSSIRCSGALVCYLFHPYLLCFQGNHFLLVVKHVLPLWDLCSKFYWMQNITNFTLLPSFLSLKSVGLCSGRLVRSPAASLVDWNVFRAGYLNVALFYLRVAPLLICSLPGPGHLGLPPLGRHLQPSSQWPLSHLLHGQAALALPYHECITLMVSYTEANLSKFKRNASKMARWLRRQRYLPPNLQPEFSPDT